MVRPFQMHAEGRTEVRIIQAWNDIIRYRDGMLRVIERTSEVL